MKLKELKEILNDLSEKELEGELVAKGRYVDGVVHTITPCDSNLYWLGDDDPSELIDENDMLKRLEEEGDDKLPEPYIQKGTMILYF